MTKTMINEAIVALAAVNVTVANNVDASEQETDEAFSQLTESINAGDSAPMIAERLATYNIEFAEYQEYQNQLSNNAAQLAALAGQLMVWSS